MTLHGLWSTRLLCPWNSSGKNSRVGCHFLLQGIFPTQELNLHLLYCRCFTLPLESSGKPHIDFSSVAQSCLTLFHPVDCSAPGFSVHRISQARIVEWVAISFSRRSRPWNGTPISFTGWQILYHMSHQGSLTNSVYMSIPISAFIPNSP